MKAWICASALVLLPMAGMAADAPPDWAYPVAPPDLQGAAGQRATDACAGKLARLHPEGRGRQLRSPGLVSQRACADAATGCAWEGAGCACLRPVSSGHGPWPPRIRQYRALCRRITSSSRSRNSAAASRKSSVARRSSNMIDFAERVDRRRSQRGRRVFFNNAAAGLDESRRDGHGAEVLCRRRQYAVCRRRKGEGADRASHHRSSRE